MASPSRTRIPSTFARSAPSTPSGPAQVCRLKPASTSTTLSSSRTTTATVFVMRAIPARAPGGRMASAGAWKCPHERKKTSFTPPTISPDPAGAFAQPMPL